MQEERQGSREVKPTIYLAHGFNVRSPEKYFRLGAIFEAAGYPVIRVDYGWTGLLSVAFATERTAKKLADVMVPGSIIVGHSNGAAIAYRAAMMGAPVRQMILINPALHRHTLFTGEILSQVDVYHARDDKVVTWGKYWRRFTPLNLFGIKSDWGEMGRVGSLVPQRSVHNHDLHAVLNTQEKIGHGGAFEWYHLDDLARHMLGRIV